jgi:hypothetical protein
MDFGYKSVGVTSEIILIALLYGKIREKTEIRGESTQTS